MRIYISYGNCSNTKYLSDNIQHCHYVEKIEHVKEELVGKNNIITEKIINCYDKIIQYGYYQNNDKMIKY